MRLVCVLLVAGCGRVAFGDLPEDAGGDGAPDALPCVPVGHDEDRDLIDDACDVCPHLLGGGLGFRQLTLYMRTAANQYYYAELYDDAAVLQWKLTYTFDGANYFNMAAAMAQGPLLNGDVTLELSNAPRAVATTSWPTPQPTIAGNVPAGLTAPTSVGFVVQGLSVRIDWFVQIHTGP